MMSYYIFWCTTYSSIFKAILTEKNVHNFKMYYPVWLELQEYYHHIPCGS